MDRIWSRALYLVKWVVTGAHLGPEIIQKPEVFSMQRQKRVYGIDGHEFA